MPYVGQKPSNGRFIELDALTASATATYTLQYNSVNFEPESVHNLIVSINGVVQKPSSMSLSGSSLTVGATLSSSDTIDYVRVLGDVGSVVTPTDGSVTSAKLDTNIAISGNLSVDTIQGKTTAGTVAMPAGMVVQTVFHKFTTNTSLDSNSDIDIGGSSFTFTPKFASSLLILSCSVAVNLYRANINQGCTINFNVDGSNIDYTGADYEVLTSLPSGTVNDYIRFHKEVSMDASNTNAKTVKLTGRPYATGSSGVAVINSSSYFTSSIKIQEIAQ